MKKLPAVEFIVGGALVFLAVFLMYQDFRLKNSGTHVLGKVASLRKETCRTGPRGGHTYICYYPRISYTDTSGAEKGFNAQRSYKKGQISIGDNYPVFYLEGSDNHEHAYVDDELNNAVGIILFVTGIGFILYGLKTSRKSIASENPS